MLPSALLSSLDGLPLSRRLKASPSKGPERDSLLAWVDSQSAALQVVGGGADQKLLLGGLWYAVDELDAAHEFFQNDPTPEGSYWHGMLHRREGDFFNARYWFQRAGRVASLPAEEGFSAVGFVKRCEASAGRSGRGSDPEELLALQVREWECLMLAAWKRVSAR